MALDAAARIAQLREDRWIDYPRAIEALDALEILLTTPPRTRMPCLLIYGDSGMGKTTLIEKLRRAHRPEFDRARRMGMAKSGLIEGNSFRMKDRIEP